MSKNFIRKNIGSFALFLVQQEKKKELAEPLMRRFNNKLIEALKPSKEKVKKCFM